MKNITALFVQTNGAYFGIEGVDPWDEKRDALLYKGDDPIIAHPPCARWCRLAGLVEKRWGYKKGDDGGTFKFALDTVRANGGVLEHHAYSDAWKAFDLPRPNRLGGWSDPDKFGGRTCHVEQGSYGHRARKATWLYAVNTDFPELRWGEGPQGTHDISYMRQPEGRKGLSQKEASATPPEFKEVLLSLARSVSA